MYKITEHPFVIWFIPQTTIDEVIENALIINLEKFMLRKFDPFQALANTNLELPVVVGQFQSVQSLDLKDATVTSQVVVRFVIEPVVVYLSLAESVMVVTTVNPKIFGGNLYLSSTPATKFYFDLVLQAITEHMKLILFAKLELLRCCNKMAGLSSLSLDAAGSLKKQGLLSIETDVLIRTLPKEMLKLTKKDAAVLTLDEMNVGGGEELPQCLKELAGKYFVFQIRVKPFNFTSNHRTFTVFAIVNHINPRFSIPMKHHLFKRKVVNHPHLSPTRLG
ncbi:BnaCnng51000D [Brassica napus]|uniref:BnaCnng51000D protein n=1 Tax=Brassica napus TaxID=3708 RepID=A0A078JFS0_BRANA|nr:BnaCnng51000D [Brassica napus]